MKSKKGHTIYSEPIFLGKLIVGHGSLTVYIPRKTTKTKKVKWGTMRVIVVSWMWHGQFTGMSHQSLQ